MQLQIIEEDLSVCKVTDYSQVELDRPFCFTGKTDEENSLVCRIEDVPDNTTERDDGWKAFRIVGVLDIFLFGGAEADGCDSVGSPAAGCKAEPAVRGSSGSNLRGCLRSGFQPAGP